MFQCCYQGSEFMRPGRQGTEGLNSMLGSRFEGLWNRETIFLSSRRGKGIGFPSQSAEAGGQALGEFPLNVQATFMDSVLVEEGIREFARLASMDTTGLNAYRDSYRKKHTLDENAFVYVKIQTSLADEYLTTDRWTFFVEDRDDNQVEPVRIVQHVVQRQLPRGNAPDGRGWREWSPTTLVLELYFPLNRLSLPKRSLDRPIELRLVVVDNNNLQSRAEGSWRLGGPRQSE
jgi:hypothetical protein